MHPDLAPTSAYSDLEITLGRWKTSDFSVALRLQEPNNDVYNSTDPTRIKLSTTKLLEVEYDPKAYGEMLYEAVFADDKVKALFEQARSRAPLRIRLVIQSNAEELQTLHWETLRDPADGTVFAVSDRFLFSRYLSNRDWQKVVLRRKGNLRALVVIASPQALEGIEPGGRELPPLDIDAELERAEVGLKSLDSTITIDKLVSGMEARPTLANITTGLRAGYDIFYFAGHGAYLSQGVQLFPEPRLYLEDDSTPGKLRIVTASELVDQLRNLQQFPMLAVLASCQSAGSGDDAASADEGALAAFGPGLAQACVPAVIAMQGNALMTTLAEFMPAFFDALKTYGAVDRAMSAARLRLASNNRIDTWVPVLFMRLTSGRIWYVPDFTADNSGIEKWPAVLDNIHDGVCTPILGPGLLASLGASPDDIARRWAKQYRFPMTPEEEEDLPEVAQYLAITQQSVFPRRQLVRELKEQLVTRYPQALKQNGADQPDAPSDTTDDRPIGEVIEQVGEYLRQDPAQPHRVLAGLPFPMYVTACPDDLLVHALRAVNKEPRVELCQWNDRISKWPASVEIESPDYEPSVKEPLVYKLFGTFEAGKFSRPDDYLKTLVVTKDDYFDYLIGSTKNRDSFPTAVRSALADGALLFLGFRLDSWDFLALFRSTINQNGSLLLQSANYAHVAVQIDPEDGMIVDPDRARRYLQEYFMGAHITIYWGRAEDFVEQLRARWNERYPAQALWPAEGGRRAP